MVSKYSYLYGIYQIQPDDRNHLNIFDNKGNLVVYIRPDGRELWELMHGRIDFVKSGGYSEEAKEKFELVAKLFREKKIKYIIFRNYPGVREFKYKVPVEKISIRIGGIVNVEYVLDMDDKVVIIKPFARNPSDPFYPFTVKVEEIPKPKKQKKPRSQKKTKSGSVSEIVEKIEAVDRMLHEIKQTVSRSNLRKKDINNIIASITKIQMQVIQLKRYIKELGY